MTKADALKLAFYKRHIAIMLYEGEGSEQLDADGNSAFLASLAASGYAVVPVEATCDMLQDGHAAIRAARSSGAGGQTVENSIRMECYREAACWRAMVSAVTGDDNG